MSLKVIEKVKKNGIFSVSDLFIYIFLAAIIVIMFVFLFIGNANAGEIKGIEISYKDAVIARFLYEENTLERENGYENYTEIKESENGFILYVYTEKGYNVLFIDTRKREVSMTDADCSKDKDCTYMHIKKPSDSIICIPHSIVITAVSEKLDIPDIVV